MRPRQKKRNSSADFPVEPNKMDAALFQELLTGILRLLWGQPWLQSKLSFLICRLPSGFEKRIFKKTKMRRICLDLRITNLLDGVKN